MNYGFEIVCASVFTIACIISARFYSLINLAYTYWDKKKVNGPIPSYIVGTWSRFAGKFLGHEDCSNILKYGKVCGTYDGLTPNLLITNPELIKEIVAVPAEKFQDVRVVSESSVILKDSLLSLSTGGDPETQTLVGSLLTSHKLEKLLPKLESTIEILINNISKERKGNGQVNITSAVTDFIDEAIAHVLFGIELNADIQFKYEFTKNTKQILKVKSPQSIWSLLPYLYEKYFKESWICPEKVLQYFVNIIISEISESSNDALSTEEKSSTLIELMVEAANEEKKLVKKEKEDLDQDLVMTDNVIISKCIASMLSLTNLTKTTLILGIYALANDEEVQEKLYKEVEKVRSETVSYEEIQQLTYLDKTVKEIMRLYPHEFRLERITKEEVKLGDIDLDKKIRVSIPLYALHRLEEYFPEPQKFDPDRFSESVSEKINPQTYLPFGQAGYNGSDISLQFGVFASKITFIRLIQKFKFSTPQQLSLDKLFQKGFTRIPQPENIEVLAELRA